MACSAGPDIVESGLVLALDAADRNSYPGSGTTWTDLSGNGNNGTLVNGVGYNSGNGGSLSFDGTNDYVQIPSSSSNILTTLSMECWFKSTGTPLNGYHVLFQKEGGFSGGAVYGLRAKNVGSKFTAMICYSSLSADAFNLASTTDIVDNTWYYVASTLDSSYVWKIYVNGVLENSTNLTSFPFQNSSTIQIGRGDGRYTNGNISNLKIYNRALSASEIQQNFNMLRGRFGI